jgi:predicted XRE-type DNA-binding protein
MRVEEVVMTRSDQLKGTNNVLRDLGFEDAGELSAKALLALKINAIAEHRGMSQTEVARITGMTQSKVSQIRNYKLLNISLERLMHALVALDQRIEITVRAARRSSAAGISVTA